MTKLKPVYAFEEADFENRMLLGGKGAGLSEMTRLKLPVPPGFTTVSYTHLTLPTTPYV